jgi:hypothetical protein
MDSSAQEEWLGILVAPFDPQGNVVPLRESSFIRDETLAAHSCGNTDALESAVFWELLAINISSSAT